MADIQNFVAELFFFFPPFHVFPLIESRKFVLFQEQLETSVIELHFCV